MIKLSKRLEHIYNLIPSNINVLCDVGCDHGKIIVKSLVENKVKKGIATDISKDSLSKAILLANKEGVDNKIELYNCYGLYEVNEKCDYTIISGLGGIEISNILKDGYQKSNYFILSPHSDITLVRKTINLLRLSCEHEEICFDKKYYIFMIITDKQEEKTYNNKELYIGKFKDYEDKIVKQYLSDRYSKLKSIIVKSYNNIDKELINEFEVLNEVFN